MSKAERDDVVSDGSAERYSRIQRERDVILALADPGQKDEDGHQLKPTHKDIAERLYAKALFGLTVRARTVRLAAAVQSIRAMSKGFIYKISHLDSLGIADADRTAALFKEVKGLYTDRALVPNDLYGIFEIKEFQPKGDNPLRSHYQSTITAPPLPQPDPESARVPIDIVSFMENVMAPSGTERYIGKRIAPQSYPVSQNPLRDYGTKIRIR